MEKEEDPNALVMVITLLETVQVALELMIPEVNDIAQTPAASSVRTIEDGKVITRSLLVGM